MHTYGDEFTQREIQESLGSNAKTSLVAAVPHNVVGHALKSQPTWATKLMQCGMQESLGGNAKTSLVIAVANAEEHVDESLQSLQFGSRAMRILTRAVVNERTDVKADISPEVLAQLEQTEDQANALALSLLAKENELEQMQGDLQVSMQ